MSAHCTSVIAHPGRLLFEHYGVTELVLVNSLRVFSLLSLWQRFFPLTVLANGYAWHGSVWTSTNKTVVSPRSRETNSGGYYNE